MKSRIILVGLGILVVSGAFALEDDYLKDLRDGQTMTATDQELASIRLLVLQRERAEFFEEGQPEALETPAPDPGDVDPPGSPPETPDDDGPAP